MLLNRLHEVVCMIEMCVYLCVCVSMHVSEYALQREMKYEGSAMMHCSVCFALRDFDFKSRALTHLNGPQFIYMHSVHFFHMSGNITPAPTLSLSLIHTHIHIHTFSDVYYHSFIQRHPKVTGHHAFKLTGFLHPHSIEVESGGIGSNESRGRTKMKWWRNGGSIGYCIVGHTLLNWTARVVKMKEDVAWEKIRWRVIVELKREKRKKYF